MVAVRPDFSASLGEVGEFAAIKFVIEQALFDVGVKGERENDASKVIIQKAPSNLVVNCDTAPKPAVWKLLESGWEAWGWLAVTAAASDIACTGSKPLTIVTSLECTRGMTLSELYDFNIGIGKACKTFGFSHAGGNLREGSRFSCHTTALGIDEWKRSKSNRLGAEDGQLLCVVGSPGDFASALFDAEDLGIQKLGSGRWKRLVEPRPKIDVMYDLFKENLVSATSDTSDGLLGAIQNICEKSMMRAVLDIEEWDLSESVVKTSMRVGIEPWRMALMWGDWDVVVTLNKTQERRAREVCTQKEHRLLRIGSLSAGKVGIEGIIGGNKKNMKLLRNEAFCENTYDSGGDARTFILKDEIFFK